MGVETWEPGARAMFEYHCLESHDSADAQAWYRSHQPVTVLAHSNPGEDWEGSTFAERASEGVPRTYRVRWDDGFEHDAWEDELFLDATGFYRPAPPPAPAPAGVPATAA